jgi:hypothetical protein
LIGRKNKNDFRSDAIMGREGSTPASQALEHEILQSFALGLE